jgi:hypothetical protein
MHFATIQMLEEEQGPQSVKASGVQRLTAMGFKEKAARIALKASGNSIDGALEQLQVRWRCSGVGLHERRQSAVCVCVAVLHVCSAFGMPRHSQPIGWASILQRVFNSACMLSIRNAKALLQLQMRHCFGELVPAPCRI